MVSLVTGGCGFIGSHMVDRLLAEGHEVRVIDNWSTGRPENLEHQKGNPNLTVYPVDIRNRDEIAPVFNGADYVFHFAALADIVPSIQRPWDYYSSNVLGTFNVVECARNVGIKKLVYAASSSCYGIPDEYLTKESAAIPLCTDEASGRGNGAALGAGVWASCGYAASVQCVWNEIENIRDLRGSFWGIFGTKAGRKAFYGCRGRKPDQRFYLCDGYCRCILHSSHVGCRAG